MQQSDITRTDMTKPDKPNDPAHTTRQDEWRAFLLLTAVVAPVATVAFVSGYGFLVWIYQMFAGPPGA